ncbi:hypothetical protein ACES2L_09375 [Bdellovibrio bacteriovorus]
MKFIYILEDDERTQQDLYESLKSIDPKLSIRFFLSLEQFHEWLKLAMHEGTLALAKGGQKFKTDESEAVEPSDTHQLRLVIAKNEFLGIKNLDLLKRARDFFIRKKLCPADEVTSLVITAFDSADFDISQAEERIINNVIFKPFDKLMLKMHLEYALVGHKPLSTETVSAMQMQSTIEMLKEVSLNSISEVGFTTFNNHPIKPGALTKYYSDAFLSDDRRSVLAVCKTSTEMTPGNFLSEFLFYGMDNKQISQIRRNILQNKDHQSQELKNSLIPAAAFALGKKPEMPTPLKIVIVDEDSNPLGSELRQLLIDKMSNIEIYFFESFTQLLSDLADKETAHRQTLPAQVDLVFANFDIFGTEKDKRWQTLTQYLSDRAVKHEVKTPIVPDLFLFSRRAVALEEVRTFGEFVKDMFFSPLDRTYIVKKLVSFNSRIINREAVNLGRVDGERVLKVANPVEITQISEAGLILKYHRSMSIGAFREFILWRPQELETPEIVGTVNYTEEDKGEEGGSLNHFVFFGMKDYFLKHIRLWLRESYIKTKDKAS